MHSDLVTVGLPVYNGEAFVHEAIESILAQEDIHLELIIADNASTDQTETVCRDAIQHDARARYVRSDFNRGAAWNFNRVVHLARGHYFKWAAHDDLCSPNFLARCIAALADDPGCSLAFARVIDIDENGTETRRWPSYPHVEGHEPAGRAGEVLRNPSPCFEAFGVTRRQQLLETDLIGNYTSSDRTFILEMALRGHFSEIQDAYLYHREHDGRSMYQYREARERGAWFDTTMATTWTLPRWRLLGEQARAVRRAKLSPSQAFRSHLAIAEWGVSKADFLARDLVGIARQAVRAR